MAFLQDETANHFLKRALNPMVKKTLSVIFLCILAFIAYLLFNTSQLKSKQIRVDAVAKIQVSDSAVHHISQAIAIKTISSENPKDLDTIPFSHFMDFVGFTYPLVDSILEKTTINKYSLLYKWKGKVEDLNPVLLAAHLDVVPVPVEELDQWNYPPFSGKIEDEAIWGRGAMDDKVGVVGILEAVEHLLSEGFVPERTIYLAFGHDEEVGGKTGAQSIANHLKQSGVRPEFVLDEGFAITRGLVPNVLTDVALIGIAEKGFVTINLSIELEGGHSSMPNAETAIEVIARAVTHLEENPFPPKITEPVQKFLEYVGPEMRFQDQLIFANNHLFRSAIISAYQKSGSGRAVVQTTMAPTLFNAGVKDNIIPAKASVSLNFRILPGTSIQDVVQKVKNTIKDDRIQIALSDFRSEPSKVSSTDSPDYHMINKSILEVFPDVIAIPNLTIAATDGRYYGEICDNIYRFLPIRLHTDNIHAIHGINEHIPVTEFRDAVRFYIQLLKNCS